MISSFFFFICEVKLLSFFFKNHAQKKKGTCNFDSVRIEKKRVCKFSCLLTATLSYSRPCVNYCFIVSMNTMCLKCFDMWMWWWMLWLCVWMYVKVVNWWECWNIFFFVCAKFEKVRWREEGPCCLLTISAVPGKSAGKLEMSRFVSNEKKTICPFPTIVRTRIVGKCHF